MIAPTGSGKTTTGMLLLLYAAQKFNKNSLILLPIATLAYQIEKKLKEYVSQLNNSNITIIGFHALSKKPSLNDLKQPYIIVTTSISLVRNKDLFKNVKIDIAFIDDVDGFLRRSKAIDAVLLMLSINISNLLEIKEVEDTNIQKEEIKLIGKQVIVSGATQSAKRTKRVKLLTKLLGFDIGKKNCWSKKRYRCLCLS